MFISKTFQMNDYDYEQTKSAIMKCVNFEWATNESMS